MRSKSALAIWVLTLIFISFLGVYPAEAQTTGALLNAPTSVFVSGNYAYVTAAKTSRPDINGLEIIDISNPAQPTHKSSVINGTGGAELVEPRSVYVSGHYAYVVSSVGHTMEILDVTDPANPVHVNTLHNQDGGARITGATQVIVSGNHAYIVSTRSQMIDIEDISDPFNIVRKGEIYNGSLSVPLSIFISGNYLYMNWSCLCNAGGGTNIYDISNPAVPVLKYNYVDSKNIVPVDINVVGNYAYIVSRGYSTGSYYLDIVDVSDPTNPIAKGTLQDGDGGANLYDARSVAVAGNYAYIASYAGSGIEIVDISDPDHPTHKGQYSYLAANSYPISLAVRGNYAYVPLQVENTLDVLDVSDPANPIHKGKIKDGETGLPQIPPLTHNPVLIIPGVLGTEISKGAEKLWLDISRNITDIGDDFMDSLLFDDSLLPIDTSLSIDDVIRKKGNGPFSYDYVDGLINEFQNQGYLENTDLFLFPYDWRYGVTGIINGTAISELLKDKIQEIRTKSGSDKVDVVAHSTGGLLLKKYVMDNAIDNKIDKAVFVGVPNTGAPKAIKALLQGESFSIPLLSDTEMKKIAKNLPVVYDLSPSQQYFNQKGSYVKIIDQGILSSSSQDLDFNQVNSFLTADHGLNNQAITNAHNLHTSNFDNYDLRTAGVDLYAIDGCKAGTIGKVVERRIKPLLGGTNILYDLETVPGDGTVPLESATNLPIDPAHKYYSLTGSHSKMLSQDGSRQQIVNIISGSSLTANNISQDISYCQLNGQAISVFSPLDIDITDSAGNHSGIVSGGIQNNIPNADFEIMGDHKFVYLPTDSGQTYTINLKGTGSGTFTLKNQNIKNNLVTGTQVFSNLPVTTNLLGKVNLSTVTTLSIDNNGDGINDQTLQPSSALNSNQSQDVLPPISTSTIIGTLSQSNFYKDKVGIKISVIDPVGTSPENQRSGILKTLFNLDNTEYKNYASNSLINVEKEGHHILKFFSTDKAGNNEEEKSIEFTINKADTTPPEWQITFNMDTKEVVFKAVDASDPQPTTSVSKEFITLKDKSGNTTIIPFIKLKETPTRMRLSYNKIIRNGVTTNIPNTNIIYEWQDKKGFLGNLDTKVTIKGVEKYVFNYKKENNATIIKERKETGVVTTNKEGFVVVTIKTEGDSLKVSY